MKQPFTEISSITGFKCEVAAIFTRIVNQAATIGMSARDGDSDNSSVEPDASKTDPMQQAMFDFATHIRATHSAEDLQNVSLNRRVQDWLALMD